MIHILEISTSGMRIIRNAALMAASEGIQLTIKDIKRIRRSGISPEDFLDLDEKKIYSR